MLGHSTFAARKLWCYWPRACGETQSMCMSHASFHLMLCDGVQAWKDLLQNTVEDSMPAALSLEQESPVLHVSILGCLLALLHLCTLHHLLTPFEPRLAPCIIFSVHASTLLHVVTLHHVLSACQQTLQHRAPSCLLALPFQLDSRCFVLLCRSKVLWTLRCLGSI